MPEMRFHVRWPDGRQEACYSPSLVVKDYLTPGQSYALTIAARLGLGAELIFAVFLYRRFGIGVAALAGVGAAGTGPSIAGTRTPSEKAAPASAVKVARPRHQRTLPKLPRPRRR